MYVIEVDECSDAIRGTNHPNLECAHARVNTLVAVALFFSYVEENGH